MNRIAYLAGLALAIGLAGPAFSTVLEVRDFRTGAVKACVPLHAGHFTLSFIHSVSLTPVKDYYRVTGTPDGPYEIRQEAEEFIAHGQGLPSMEGEPDALDFIVEDGRFTLRMDRAVEPLILRTDPRFKNRLESGEVTIDLTQWLYGPLQLRAISGCANNK